MYIRHAGRYCGFCLAARDHWKTIATRITM